MIHKFPKKAPVLILLCEWQGCHVSFWIINISKTKRSYQILFMNITKIFDRNLCFIWSLGEYFYYFYGSSPFLALYHLHRDIRHISLKVPHASLCLENGNINVHSFPNSIVSLRTIFFPYEKFYLLYSTEKLATVTSFSTTEKTHWCQIIPIHLRFLAVHSCHDWLTKKSRSEFKLRKVNRHI